MFINKMRRVTVLAVLLLFTLCSAAYAATSTDLLDVLPGEQGDVLTRSEFCAMLVKSAGLQPTDKAAQLPGDVKADAWYADDIQILISANILRNSADNTVKPDRPITQAEAVALIARTLGLPQIPAPEIDQLAVSNNHWAFNDYSWMVSEDLINQVDPQKVLTPQDGADLLTHVFGTAEQCKEIIDKMEAANKDITSMRMTGEMDMQMNMRETTEIADMPPSISAKASMETELVMDKGLHMIAETSLPTGEDQAPQSLTIEQYMTNDGMFMGIPDPETKKVTWAKIPSDVLPNMMELIKQQANPLPDEIKNMFHYRYLGEEKLADRNAYKLAYYGEIKDLTKMMAAFGQLGGQLQQVLEQSQGILESITYVGTMYVDKEIYLPLSTSNYSVVTCANEFQNQPMPIETMRIGYDFTFSDYNASMDIVLPKEALNAEEISLPAPNADSETVPTTPEQ